MLKAEGAVFHFGGEVGGAGGGVAGGGHEGFEGGVGWDAAEGEGVIEVGDVFGAATLGGLHGKNMVSALVEGGEKEGG